MSCVNIFEIKVFSADECKCEKFSSCVREAVNLWEAPL